MSRSFESCQLTQSAVTNVTDLAAFVVKPRQKDSKNKSIGRWMSESQYDQIWYHQYREVRESLELLRTCSSTWLSCIGLLNGLTRMSGRMPWSFFFRELPLRALLPFCILLLYFWNLLASQHLWLWANKTTTAGACLQNHFLWESGST